MHKENIITWGRRFELEVIFDCYPDETVLPIQEETLAMFLNMEKEIADSETMVKEYCIRNYSDRLEEDTISNIFRYVIPEYIFIKRNPEKHIAALLCRDRFNSEHGMAVIFKEKKLFQIGTQDSIL